MNEYTILFQFFTKKQKIKIFANTEQEAREKFFESIKIDKIIEKNFIIDYFNKNIFKK